MDHYVEETHSFLIFLIEEELFAVDVKKVIEVLRNQQVFDVPKTEDYIKGIINFRGNVLTVIDTRIKMNLPSKAAEENPVIIVFELTLDDKSLQIGALADKVVNVRGVGEKEIKPVPDFGSYYNPEFLLGAFKLGEKFAMILDIEKILSAEEVSLVNNIGKNNGIPEKT